MNEKIKELLLKVVPRAGEDGEYLPSLHTPQDIEQFAELIVRECAGIYSKIDNGNQHMGTDNYLEALHKTFRS